MPKQRAGLPRSDDAVQAFDEAVIDRLVGDLYDCRRQLNRLGLYVQANAIATVMADLEVLRG